MKRLEELGRKEAVSIRLEITKLLLDAGCDARFIADFLGITRPAVYGYIKRLAGLKEEENE